MDTKSDKNTAICYIEYNTVKKIGHYENIYSVNPLYLITGEVDGDIEEKKGLNILLSILQIKTSKYLKKKRRTLWWDYKWW